MVYHGPKALEELVSYDPHLVVGILGGSAGTTLDAFQLIHESRKYGARVALFGRKINNAENQLAFIQFLRYLVEGVIEPVEAVRAYHAVLEKLDTRPNRSLEEDLTLQTGVMSYSGSGTTISVPPKAPSNGTAPTAKSDSAASAKSTSPKTTAGPDFASMSSEERLEFHRNRLNRLFGETRGR